MTRAQWLFMGVVGVVMAGASLGCGSDPAPLATTEASVSVAGPATQDVALRIEGMT